MLTKWFIEIVQKILIESVIQLETIVEEIFYVFLCCRFAALCIEIQQLKKEQHFLFCFDTYRGTWCTEYIKYP